MLCLKPYGQERHTSFLRFVCLRQDRTYIYHKNWVLRFPSPLSHTCTIHPSFFCFPFVHKICLAYFSLPISCLVVIIIPPPGHGDGIVLDHFERTAPIVQILLPQLNFAVIHVPASAANEQSGDANDRPGNQGHPAGGGDVVVLVLAGGVGNAGGDVGLAVANELGAIGVGVHEELGHELLSRQEPILVAPRGQGVGGPEGVGAILGAVAVAAAGPRAQIDGLGFVVLVECVLVGKVVELGISRVEADLEHGVRRRGRHAAERQAGLDGHVLAQRAVPVVGVAVEGGRGGRDREGRVAIQAGDGNVGAVRSRDGSEKEQRCADEAEG
mmetsp:Transcript_12389/g.35449  ORF Transcript_12389/g.35449 Transcript_12389/m.35449 type:complete len:327 (-) Transcript_12389:302-1282(-)